MVNYEAMDLFRYMEPNQALFVHHLRTNPHGVYQISGDLVQDDKHMCALGLGLEAFDMIAAYKAWENNEAAYPGYDPYKEIAKVLDMPKRHVDTIYSLNDDYGLSFGEIADVMEEYFKQDNLFDWAASSPEIIWVDQKDAERAKRCQEFVAKWDQVVDEYGVFMRKAANTLGVSYYDLDDSALSNYEGEEFFDEIVEPEEY
jgi:transcriptional regulator with XRE-family HTH domain